MRPRCGRWPIVWPSPRANSGNLTDPGRLPLHMRPRKMHNHHVLNPGPSERQKRHQGAASSLREENMADAKKLSSMDASFLYLETPEMPMHVGSMAIFRLPDDYKGDFFEDFKAMIASRLHVAPILKPRREKAPLEIHHPCWDEAY